MALSTIITKKSVSESQERLYQITLNMKYQDGTTILLDQDFTERYKTGQVISIILERFKEQMKLAIRHYKEAQVIFNAAALDAVVTNLNSTVGV